MSKYHLSKIYIAFGFLFFITAIFLFTQLAEAGSLKEISLDEYYINQDNVKSVQIYGNIKEAGFAFVDKMIRITLQDSIGGTVIRTGLIDSGGKFSVTLDATGLIDGKIILNASVLSRSGQTASRGEIERGEQIFNELILIKDTLPPQGLILNSVETPTSKVLQSITGRKPKSTSVWLNEREIIQADKSTFFSYDLKLKEGDNKISLTVRDKYGNKSKPIEAIITYSPTKPRATLEYEEEAGTGKVTIKAKLSQEVAGTLKVSVNTEKGQDLPPSDMTGSGTTWEYKYQGSKSFGKATVTILEEDRTSGTVTVVPTENATFTVSGQVVELKTPATATSWELPPPPAPTDVEPFPPPITSTTIEELDETPPKIIDLQILDAGPVYKNGATIHLGVEYEDISYDVAKTLLGGGFNPDEEYRYIEEDFSKDLSSWRPIRVNFGKVDSQAQIREIRVGPLIKVSNERFRRTISYRISIANTIKDAENIEIEAKVINLLNKVARKSTVVRLFNSSPIAVKREVHYRLEKIPEKPLEELSLSGKGRPNATYVLYIYSDPIVITVKTDSEGNWSYTLKKSLSSGDHTVYAAEVSEEGNVGEAVQIASFVVPALAAQEEGKAVQSDGKLEFPEVQVPKVTGKDRSYMSEFILIAALFVSGVVFILLGIAPDILNRLKIRSKRRN